MHHPPQHSIIGYHSCGENWKKKTESLNRRGPRRRRRRRRRG
jgi:hypothetical protein